MNTSRIKLANEKMRQISISSLSINQTVFFLVLVILSNNLNTDNVCTFRIDSKLFSLTFLNTVTIDKHY